MPVLSKKVEDQALGRSRGGLSTKIHALVDALGNPLRFLLTSGQAHDLAGADLLFATRSPVQTEDTTRSKLRPEQALRDPATLP